MYNTLIITNLIQLSHLKTEQEITGIVKSFNHVINIDQYFFLPVYNSPIAIYQYCIKW